MWAPVLLRKKGTPAAAAASLPVLLTAALRDLAAALTAQLTEVLLRMQ
jgi:hypothetical protein